jgi:hypothetical protein
MGEKPGLFSDTFWLIAIFFTKNPFSEKTFMTITDTKGMGVLEVTSLKGLVRP